MKIKLIAPEGYKYKDTRTGRTYSVVVVDYVYKRFFVLVADNSDKIMEG